MFRRLVTNSILHNIRQQTVTNVFSFLQNKCKVRPTIISSMHSIVVCITYNYRDVKCSTMYSKVPLHKNLKIL